MKLRRVGFFRELAHGDPTGPGLVELVNDRPRPEGAKTVAYLRDGLLLIGCPGVVSDVLDGDAGPIGPPHIMTDGVWAWPGDLPVYLEKYHVTLPEEFINHLRMKSFRPPTVAEVDLGSLEL